MAHRQRTVAVSRPRNWRHWLVALAVGGAALTAVQVSALWKAPTAVTPRGTPPLETRSGDVDLTGKIARRLQMNPLDSEAALLQSLLSLKDGDLPGALALLDNLTRRSPSFHLAHLVRGDLLLAQFRPLDDIGRNGVVASLGGANSEPIERLRDEARARLQGYLALLDGTQVPSVLISLADEITSAVVVDKSRNRLYLFENPGSDRPPRLVADYYSVFGKLPGNKQQRGDLRTPEGVYFVTGQIPGERLPSRYGTQAFPLNYPNEYDRRAGKTGDGIWLHGTDREYYSRPPQDSDGCVVLANDDLQALSRHLQPGKTPVVIADQLEWISPTEWRSRREEVVATVEAWRRDWETDVERYLGHYSADFHGAGLDYAAWSQRKRQLARRAGSRQVDVDRLSLFSYPTAASGGKPLVVAEFQQRYRSTTFASDMEKRLYLVREEQVWRIWYEGGR